MAKRRTKRTGIKQVLISLGILFSVILFIIKVVTGGIGWFGVFAPVIITFFIVFLLSAIRSILRKV